MIDNNIEKQIFFKANYILHTKILNLFKANLPLHIHTILS